MEPTKKAFFMVHWSSGTRRTLPVQFNPKELSFDKSLKLGDISIPGLDAPLLQYVRGESEKLTLKLFFDTTEDGMGAGATSVTTRTDEFYELVKIDPGWRAPPICEFCWSEDFPGSNTTARTGSQQRSSFKCVVESIKQEFTLFSPEGVPLRATLNMTLREYRPLEEQIQQTNAGAAYQITSQLVGVADTLQDLAARAWQQPGQWRRIAEHNNVEDPRRLTVGAFIQVPARR
jgi:hypothetical protein